MTQQPSGFAPLFAPHKLSELLAGLAVIDRTSERYIHGLSLDSRNILPGDLFLALAGAQFNGKDFIDAAIAAGAAAVVYPAAAAGTGGISHAIHEAPRAGALPVPLFGISHFGRSLGVLADRFYRHPSRHMFITGVTGTNGKTSVSHFLAHALAIPNQPCGVIGTLGNGLFPRLNSTTLTTPDAVAVHALLAQFRKTGARNVVMEASSHGLDQGRVDGVAFDLAVFTNLSRDHLDYHGDMTAYANAKRRLFFTPGLSNAVINGDDAFGRELLATLPTGVTALAYGLTDECPHIYPVVRGAHLVLSLSGLEMDIHTPWGTGHLRSPLLGRFNATNLLAALAGLLVMGWALPAALERLAQVGTPRGRMEPFTAQNRALAIVDYAHTPDALQQVLYALREHVPPGAKLWCVFGCGGNRDRGKRPLMGAIAAQLADVVVVTDDNPRDEDALEIIAAIVSGMPHTIVRTERPREQAIAFALSSAVPGDIVLIAGKGHEEIQQIGSDMRCFSDREHVLKQLKGEPR